MTAARVSSFVLMVLLVGTGPASAQDPLEQFDAGIRDTAARLRGEGAGSPGLTVGADAQLFVLALTVRDDQLLARAEENRTDKQLGADGATAGGTSIASKGGIPRIFAFAVENGALSRSQSGTTLTFRGTPVGAIKALAGLGYLQTYEQGDPTIALLQKVSFGVSFDTARGVDDGAPAFTGRRNQVSSLSARVSLIDQRDPRRAQYDAGWTMLAEDAGIAVASSVKTFVAALLGPSEAAAAFNAWLMAANQAIAAAPPDRLEQVIRDQLRELRLTALPADVLAAAASARGAYDRLLGERARLLEQVEHGAQLVVDYVNDRPIAGNTTSTVRVVASKGGPRVSLTGNVAVTFLNGSLPARISSRTRDLTAAAQVDIPLGRAETIGRYVVSLAYRFERLNDDIADPAGAVLPGTKGTLSIGQVKLTMPIKDSAIRIPLSVTFANRSELVRERIIRGHIGVSYDLDAVFARFRP